MPNSPIENRLFHEILLDKMSNFTQNTSEKPNSGGTQRPFVEGKYTVFSSKIYKFTPAKTKIYGCRGHHFTAKQKVSIATPKATNHLPTEQKYSVSSLSTLGQLTLTALGFKFNVVKTQSAQVKISEIKSAFRRIARKLHPDLNPTVSYLEFASIKQSTDALLAELKSIKTS